jgi:putative membrane protein insertion efficiency factor
LDEEKFKNTYEYCRQAQARVPQPDEKPHRKKRVKATAPKGQEKYLFVMLKSISVFLIIIYQGSIRNILPATCRFTPTCSEYAKEAITKYGFFKGGFKALHRLLRCHPYSGKAGIDPLV